MPDPRRNLVPPRRRRRLAAFAVALATLSAAPLWAQEQPARPAVPATGSATEPAEELRATQQEWDELAAFMEKNSPSKWMVARRAPPAGKLKQGILRRYRQLQVVARADPERYALEEKAIRIEDRIYACLRDIQAGTEPDKNERLLREHVSDLIDNRNALRKARVERVGRELAALGMTEAVNALRAEAQKKDPPGDGGRLRQKRIDDRVEDLKKHLKPTLRGGGRPPIPPPTDTAPAGE